MTKWLALSAGVFTSAALLYRFQYDIEHNTDEIRKKLYNNQNKLESSLPMHLKDGTTKSPPKPSKTPNNRPELPLPSISQTEQYISRQFIPTFKNTWNENITNIAQKLANFDASEATKSGYESAKAFAEEKLGKKK